MTTQQSNSPVQQLTNQVYALESSFNELVAEANLKFKTEAHFAIQLLQKNDYLMKIALQNPQSLKNAILNVASVGLSLNPAEREAYLVPRKGSICLDVSYIGFVNAAVSSGALKYVVSKVVHENDKFEFNGMGQEPTHKFEPFGDRGPAVGVYVVAVTAQNTYLVESMSIAECHAIRDRSETWKAKPNTGAWATDEGEMLKKTVIKRAAKLWPKPPKDNRLAEAIRVVNEHDGIDFQAEREAVSAEKQALIEAVHKKQAEERAEKTQLVDVVIKDLCADLTEGQTAQEKGLFMREVMGIRSWNDLNHMSLDDLDVLVKKLEALKGDSIVDHITQNETTPKDIPNYADNI